ncbi:MAG: hypothetical protein RXR08_12765 [Sulfolobaceae archaeon]
MATEGDFLIIEDPKTHLSEKDVSEVVIGLRFVRQRCLSLQTTVDSIA